MAYAAVNGLNMYYEIHGDGPPLLLLHGGTGSGDLPVSDAYRRLSPDGVDHWPIVLGRLQRMWVVEPNFTREQMQSIKAPTLIIVGDGDIVTPEHAVEMFRVIPGAQLCVVPHARHGTMPNDTIQTFLK
jgi:pimeloyl-ACP methyl ester carboxylesterase